MLDSIFSNINLSQKALDGSSLKHKVIANNLSNVDTPGYKRSDVSFHNVLKAEINKRNGTHEMYKTDPRHMDINGQSKMHVEKVKDSSYRMDQNNVDIDVENAKLASNTLYYNSVVTDLNSEIRRLKSVMKVGG